MRSITGHRTRLKIFLAMTFLLGFTFVALQATEYHEAYTELGLQLGTGIYGSTFFMLTGFHGLHVTVGAIMLTVIWFRVMKGHFTPAAPFWLRSRRMVLALRRRGVARVVYLRLLAVAAVPTCCGFDPARCNRRRSAARTAATDKPIRQANALTILTPSSGLRLVR